MFSLYLPRATRPASQHHLMLLQGTASRLVLTSSPSPAADSPRLLLYIPHAGAPLTTSFFFIFLHSGMT